MESINLFLEMKEGWKNFILKLCFFGYFSGSWYLFEMIYTSRTVKTIKNVTSLKTFAMKSASVF